MFTLQIMGVLNLTPDSFFAPSRVNPEDLLRRISELVSTGASIIDLGAVSTRPGAEPVGVEEEWARLESGLRAIASQTKRNYRISIDTTSSEIVRRACDIIGPFMVNDISAGEDDSMMLPVVGELGLDYVAMHKRGNPRTMDAQVLYPQGVTAALKEYFEEFSLRASEAGVKNWILDPGLGFAKTNEQNWELLENLSEFTVFKRPILIGAADKRFTKGDTESAHRLVIQNLYYSDSDLILRVHDVPAALYTVSSSKMDMTSSRLP